MNNITKYYDITELNCPIDNFIIDLSNKVLPFISKYLNESDIYCISLLFSFLSGFFIKNKIKILPGIFFFLGYIFKIFYSHYIQKYKKQTHIDNHIFTLIAYIYLLIIIYQKNNYMFIIVFILMVPIICNWACEIDYIKSKYPKLYHIPLFNDKCSILCPYFKNYYKYSKIFGDGSLTLIISIYLAYI